MFGMAGEIAVHSLKGTLILERLRQARPQPHASLLLARHSILPAARHPHRLLVVLHRHELVWVSIVFARALGMFVQHGV